MPAFKNDKAKGPNKWYCSFYYKDYEGNRKQKTKRGFAFKREAEQWEREFKLKYNPTSTMKFESLAELFLDNTTSRVNAARKPIKESTRKNWESVIKHQILPTFAELPINTITKEHIQKWQDDILVKLAPTTQKKTCTILSIIFNFAVKNYGLAENPCDKAGSTGTSKREKMGIWTIEQFNQLLDTMLNNPLENQAQQLAMFYTLIFYTGLRIGEARALTIADYDPSAHTIYVNKSANNDNEITKPKTKKSIRVITIPVKVCAQLDEHIKRLQQTTPEDRLFQIEHLGAPLFYLKKYAKLAGLPVIRIHDLRHSHASMLINAGVQPLAISERLGHESIQTTMTTYAHIYQATADSVAKLLDNMIK